jgi:hypothetical protein
MAYEAWRPGGTIEVLPGDGKNARIKVTRYGDIVDGDTGLEVERSETFTISAQDLKMLIVQALQPEGLQYE